ncbi:XPG, N-terminal [Dillenia turbinata]|uniref:XPG, N-terminal n=1 Tax=Dillenia turbinata TaxID=194707 RepID=A0AAN8Z617_9MAGN
MGHKSSRVSKLYPSKRRRFYANRENVISLQLPKDYQNYLQNRSLNSFHPSPSTTTLSEPSNRFANGDIVMGVKNLWDILESCKKKLPLHHLHWSTFRKKRVCVDLSCWTVQLQDANKSHTSLKDKLYFNGLFNRIRALFALNCSLIFVTDGSIPATKLGTYRHQLNLGCEVHDETNSQKFPVLRRNMGSEFSYSDVFFFGARQFIETFAFIALAVLHGGDYSQGVHGLGLESACQIVKRAGDPLVIQKIASEGLSFAKNEKSKRQWLLLKCNNKENVDPQMNIKGSEHELQSGKQFVQIINAYLKPKCHPADSDAVYSILFCMPNFSRFVSRSLSGLLKKQIAERDLRRFDQRASSSEVGVHLPLKQMPVKCPVSEIIKPRKVQGRECYEVAWAGINGLGSSTVPTDLIERLRSLKRKELKGRRSRTLKNQEYEDQTIKASATELEKKLQDLWALKRTIQSAILHAQQFLTTKFPRLKRIFFDQNAATCSYQTGQNTSQVIDLLSPKPQFRTRNVTKCEQVCGECVDVINLSDL